MRIPQLHRAIVANETITARFKRNIRVISENALPVEFQCSPEMFAGYADAQYQQMADGFLSVPTNAVTILFTGKTADLMVFARLRDRVILDCVGVYFVRGEVAMAAEMLLVSGPDITETAIITTDDIFVRPDNLADEKLAQFGWTAIHALFAALGAMNENAIAFRPVAAKPAKARRVVIRNRPSPHWRTDHVRRLPSGKKTHVRRALIRGDVLPTYH